MQLEAARNLKVEARARLRASQLGQWEQQHFALDHIKAHRGFPQTPLADARWKNSVSLGVWRKDDGDFGLSARVRTAERRPDLEETIRRALAPVASPEDLDLQHTGPVFALRGHVGSPNPSTTLTIGASISHYLTLGGSLGFFATSRLNGERGLVSANHVIGELDAAQPGDAIVHPSGADPRQNKVAEFVRCVPLGGGGEKHVDAAFARLTTNDFDPSALPDGRLQPQIAPLGESNAVKKFGHRTGPTAGTVTSFDYDGFEILGYRDNFGVVKFEDQIEVKPAVADMPFALDGDSGAVAYDSSFRAVGLIFGGTFAGLTYVSPMRFVLDLLEVDLLT
jgi:hypothetical protein